MATRRCAPQEVVIRVDQVEILDKFASKVDGVWAVVAFEAAPHLTRAGPKRPVSVPAGDPERPIPCLFRLDDEHVYPLNLKAPDGEDTPEEAPPPPPEEGAHPKAPNAAPVNIWEGMRCNPGSQSRLADVETFLKRNLFLQDV